MPSTLAIIGCYTTEQRKARGKALRSVTYPGWEPLGELPDANPSFQVIDPDKSVIYSVHGDMETASAYKLDPATGALSKLSEVAAGGKNGVALVRCPDAPYVFISNYSSGAVSALPVAPDGALGDAVFVLDLPGEPGPHRKEQPFGHPHDAIIDPSGKYLIVPDKGLDRVFAITWTPTGELSVASSVQTRPGAGPRHLKFHPNGKYAYAVGEIDSSVYSFAWDADAGEFTALHVVPALPSDYFPHSTTAEVIVDPAGRFVFVSNRGLNHVTRFAIDPDDPGKLTVLGWTDCGGPEPRFMTLSPDGSRLIVANEQGDNIVEFAIGGDGSLSEVARVSVISPSSIIFVETTASRHPGQVPGSRTKSGFSDEAGR
ncbi:MAG: lactonase family protein [Propionibacteriaceae bacterium]|jgi:6-phosphogluconolactonase (cycloisomerase 2 family)|nr:lactonase family protein [Propionibacteriaceae bacterium]